MPRGATQSAPVPESLKNMAVLLVADAFGVERKRIDQQGEKDAWTQLAKQVAIYLVAVEGDFTSAAVGRAFGISRASVRYARARVEDFRSRRLFDGTVETLASRLKMVVLK